MTSATSALPLVVLLGPTATGKSALGIWLSERLGGEVLACDSAQLYRGLDIGTGKPRAAERRGIAHHLLDVLEPHENATAGAYRQMAVDVLEELRQRKCLPVITAGTGLYLRALLEGLADAPKRSEELRDRLRTLAREHRPGYLHCLLKRLDAAAALRIQPADEQKLIRAVEVCLLAKKRLSEVHRLGRSPLEGWRALKIGLRPPREALHRRIQARVQGMLDEGWIEEVRGLVERGAAEDAKVFDFIGYQELRAVLRGELTMAEAATAIQQATRNYAKRQLTWFARETAVHWLCGFGEESSVQGAALQWLKEQGCHTRHDGVN